LDAASAGTGNVGDPVQSCPQSKHWIEIQLQDANGKPIPGEEYIVTLPDGEEVTGSLDANGFARIDPIEEAGACKVSFPKIDSDIWKFDRSERALGES
jgi:hypothetical protein